MKNLNVLLLIVAASIAPTVQASTPIFKCASAGKDSEKSFRVNVITSQNGTLKATILKGQTTANTWVTYAITEKKCNGGGGRCFSGESKTKLQGSTFKFDLKVTYLAAKNDNLIGLKSTVKADVFDIRLPFGNQRFSLPLNPHESIVCAQK